jgi:hypothetical protein
VDLGHGAARLLCHEVSDILQQLLMARRLRAGSGSRREGVMVALGLMLALVGTGEGRAGSDYRGEVKPILERRCYACHGALKQKAGLRLDTAQLLLKGGDSGPAVEPGSAEESLIIDKVSESDPKLRMPPEGEALSATEIELIRRWIDDGAASPAEEAQQADPRAHWAFQPPRKVEVVSVSSHDGENPIDGFVDEGLARAGVSPARQADAEVLLRRVTLDLTGLAPTRDERERFLADMSPDAYERLVERLLASPAYGERWGRHWMDIWRYSDWYGFGDQIRHSQPHIWRWRDWIVESLNEDKGYDRMLVEMLAGDELAPEDPQVLRATGYLARNWFKFNRNEWLKDSVDHTAKAFLGLTFACARCHDHKYDPIEQVDYYRLRAFFEPHDVRVDRVPGQPDTAKDGVARVQDAKPDAPTHLFHRGDEKQPEQDRKLVAGLPAFLGSKLAIEAIELPPRAYYTSLEPHVRRETLEAAEKVVAEANSRLGERLAELAGSVPGTEAAVLAERGRDAAMRNVVAAQAELASVRARIAADDARFARPADSKHAQIEAIRAARAERLASYRRAEARLAEEELSLLDLARRAGAGADDAKRKLTEAREALEKASSVVLERQGTLHRNDGEYGPIAATHPAKSTGRRLALARWIASEANPLTARVAVNHVWMRHFGQPLVATVFDFGNHGARPTHPELLDWLATDFMEHGWSLKHLHRRIVTSRAYRRESSTGAESASASAAIDPENRLFWRMNPRRMEAELVRDNLLAVAGTLDLARGGPELDQGSALTTNRRSVYYRHAPEKQAVFLTVFDAANSEACYRRDVSVVPQQSLALVNSTLARAQARRLAAQITGERGAAAEQTPDDAFVTEAFTRVLGRGPDDEESAACAGYLTEEACRQAGGQGGDAFAEGPEQTVAPAADARQRARENLVHVLFNHHEFVTIR